MPSHPVPIRPLVGLLLSAFIVALLPAAEYVNWGGPNYVGGNGQNLAGVAFDSNENRDVMSANDETGDFDLDGLADDVRDRIAYNPAEPFSPSVGYGGLSNVFRGGVQVVRLNAASVAPTLNLKVLNQSTGDRLRIGLNSDGAGAFDLVSGFVVWTQEDFLKAGIVTLDLESGLALNRVALTNCRLRLIVRDGSTFYVSASTYDSSAGLAVLSRSALASESWSIFADPSSLRFTGTTFAPVSFTDITAVGFYFESWRNAANPLPSGQNFNLTIDEFVFGAP